MKIYNLKPGELHYYAKRYYIIEGAIQKKPRDITILYQETVHN